MAGVEVLAPAIFSEVRKVARIKYSVPIVEMQGDEMTRILWDWIKEILLEPYVELNCEFYDLGLPERDKTDDEITERAADAIKKYGVGVKCATITPNAKRVEEYGLKKMWLSPNGTIRARLDGTVFREPVLCDAIRPYIPTWTKPIVIARHAYGDVYRNTEIAVEGEAEAVLEVKYKNGKTVRNKIADFSGGGVVQGVHNTDASIENFARSCFTYALDAKRDLWFATKDTISKTYDRRFKEIFETVFGEYREKFAAANIKYEYSLIDDSVARIIRSNGGMIWALKNYDGDVMSDMVATAFGSLAMMTSVLVSPLGAYEYEAAHGTVTRHYYRYRDGEATSTNPVATIFAWTGALRKRGEKDGVQALCDFAANLEKAVLSAINCGFITGDLKALYAGKNAPAVLDSRAFLKKIKEFI